MPVVANFNSYPARFSFTVDDVGSSPGTEGYINSLLPVFSTRGLKLNAAVVPSYPVDWESVRSWYAAGHEIDSHSWSHQYYSTNTNPQNAPPYPNAAALDIRYTGAGSAATVTIAGNVLSTNVEGAPADNLSVNLAAAPYDTMAGLENYLEGLANYSIAYDTSGPLVRPNTHSVNLLDVTNRDIKNSTAILVYDQTKLVPDEMTSSKAEIERNVPGLTERFLVYPDARNTARQDSELAATQARVQRLEQIAATTTEARIRTEVQLGELRDGQNEIKVMLQGHDNASRRINRPK
jgi:hypothetical protein